ncbi:MAG: DUF2846 domain-containing protein [Pseudomonadales bacterium]|nr:DUF2846 domain-containing protein [Pseudomonadales bacterium]
MRTILLLVISILLIGCETVQTVPYTDAPVPTISNDHGIVYIYRANKSSPYLNNWHFLANGKRVCTLAQNTYCWITLPEGTHILSATINFSDGPYQQDIEISINAGEKIYTAYASEKQDNNCTATIIGGMAVPSGDCGPIYTMHYLEKTQREFSEFLKKTKGYAINNGIKN